MSGALSTGLVLWLPARRYFAGQALSRAVGASLARADSQTLAEGDLAQQRRPFEVGPSDSWPSAALIEATSRVRSQVEPFQWLRADPVWLQPDITTARLMAWGNLSLSDEESASLLRELKPLFGDAGFVLEAREPEAWVLQVPRGSSLPEFPHPLDALGDEGFSHLPQGPDARRWRSLLGEVQVLMHHHPVNAARASRGQPPANSLWFWGAGALPNQVRCRFSRVASADPEVRAYAVAAGCDVTDAVNAAVPGLIDLRAERAWSVVEDVLGVATAALRQGSISAIELDFADGFVYVMRPSQRWRVWRRPLTALSS
jgi:hypothetical protein